MFQVRLDQEVLGGIKVPRGLQENKVKKVTVEKRVLRVCQGPKETKVPLEFQVSLALKVPLDQEETLGQRVQEDQGVALGLQGREVMLVYLVLLAEMVNQVLRDLRAPLGHKGQRDLQVHKDLLALLVLWVCRDHLVQLDLLLKGLNLYNR